MNRAGRGQSRGQGARAGLPAGPGQGHGRGRRHSHTNEAEMRLRELGFRIFVTRLYDSAGQPVTLTNAQTTGAKP